MTTRRNNSNRLNRIERKCNAILSELTKIRRGLNHRSSSVDDAIDRMHLNARRMRAEAEKDVRLLRWLLQLK